MGKQRQTKRKIGSYKLRLQNFPEKSTYGTTRKTKLGVTY